MGHYNQNRQKVKNRFTACYGEQSDDCGRKLKEWRMVKSDGSAEVQCATSRGPVQALLSHLNLAQDAAT